MGILVFLPRGITRIVGLEGGQRASRPRDSVARWTEGFSGTFGLPCSEDDSGGWSFFNISSVPYGVAYRLAGTAPDRNFRILPHTLACLPLFAMST